MSFGRSGSRISSQPSILFPYFATTFCSRRLKYACRSSVRLQVILPHERANARVAFPLLAGYLIAADVKERIGKERGHLADECVQKLIGGFARRVHGGIEHAPIAFDLIGPGRAGKFRIADQPTGRVAGDIEFGYYANAAIPGIRDDFVEPDPACNKDRRNRAAASFGKRLLSTRKPWSSERCQWKTFSFTAAMPSRLRLTTSMGIQCRETSRCSPRQGKRGWSWMSTAGA